MSKGLRILMATVMLAVANTAAAADFYYDLDTIYTVTPSASRIVVQFDTASGSPAPVLFAAGQSCIDDTAMIESLGRGFWVFGIESGCGYEATAASVESDPAVSRVLPVYRGASGGEFAVTDLVSVQFRYDLSADSCLAILDQFGLHFVDSDEYVHNWWHAALHDTIRDSPLHYGNALHVLPETEWASATMYDRPVLFSLPPDPYFPYQYYLRNTGQNGGTVDADIDADSAWLFGLADSNLVVAVLDDGLISHADLPASRFLPGRDFVGANWSDPVTDYDPRPGDSANHGMACAGVLAGSHNGIGIAGVCGSARIVPVKIFDDGNHAHGQAWGTSDPEPIVNAILYAANAGARVMSNSWGYVNPEIRTDVANAIRYAVNGCGGGVQPLNSQARTGVVMVFAAGNLDTYWNPYNEVVFPANMPEVIAVGASTKSNGIWWYSCRGSALDLVAPSGEQWTIDQTADLGWNPFITGPNDANGDRDYTSVMGGTSGACPQVAGIAALLMARYVDVSYCNPGPEIREILINSADDLGAVGWDPTFGYGRANAFKALVATSHGDVNGDALYDIRDVTMIVDQAFRGDLPPALHPSLSDITCDGVTSVADVVRIVNIVFRGDGPPAPCYLF